MDGSSPSAVSFAGPSRTVSSRQSLGALRQLLATSPGLSVPSPGENQIDIVVPVYNAPDQSLACLESIARHTTTPYRLIVINDGSPDGTIAEILHGVQGASPHLITVDRAQNLGF